MNIEETVARLEREIKKEKQTAESMAGMARLSEVMTSYDGEYRLIWSDDLLKKIKERPVSPMHFTGMESLDGLIGGFREQQLITVSAHSKHGKTAFGLFLMEKLSSMNPVMIPMEQSNEEIVEQRSENGHSIPRFLSPENMAARRTVEWIEERIVEGIAKYNTKMVLIDHLGYIDDFGENGKFSRENLAYRIQLVMQGLKTVAKNWKVVIVLLVHISQGDEGKPPQNEDLKGSSGILQESDKVIFLWRKNELKKKIRVYENRTMVYVTANRRTGKNGNIGLYFDSRTGQYIDDNAWVAAMTATAQQEVKADDDFNEGFV